MTDESLREFVHDARGSLGSIRLSIDSLLEDDGDLDFRRLMLRAVDTETRRLAACLDALPATLIEPSAVPEEIDLVVASSHAARRASETGLSVRLSAPANFVVSTPLEPADVGEGLLATLRLAAGAKAALDVEVGRDGNEVVISGGERWPMAAHLLHRLSTALGAALTVTESEVVLRWCR